MGRNIVVGLFVASKNGDGKPFDRFDLGIEVDRLHVERTLKAIVRQRVAKLGYKPLSINVLAKKEHGIDIAVGVTSPILATKKKAVTRGNRLIESEPLMGVRTMAHKRRVAQAKRGKR